MKAREDCPECEPIHKEGGWWAQRACKACGRLGGFGLTVNLENTKE